MTTGMSAKAVASIGRVASHLRIPVLAIAFSRGAAVGSAADFFCQAATRPEDTACLIAAINSANATGEADTITLEMGVILLTAVDNDTDGPNGLPSITSEITIRGDDPLMPTQIERRVSGPSPTPNFRIFHVAATGKLTLESVQVNFGLLSSGQGAGILNAGGVVHLSHVLVRENAGSGGIVNEVGGNLTMAHSTVYGNGSGNVAGGCCGVLNKGVATIKSSAIKFNTGPGIRNSGGTLQITNSTIGWNAADDSGGAGLLNEDAGSVSIASSTVSENYDGGIANAGGTVELQNSILVGNRAVVGQYPYPISNCSGDITSLGNNVIGVSRGTDGCLIDAVPSDIRNTDTGVVGQFTGNGAIPGSEHFQLVPGSPAIDAANAANPGSGGGACEAMDQNGLPRPADGDLDGRALCDIGSSEFFPITGFSPTFGPVGTSVVIRNGGGFIFAIDNVQVKFGAIYTSVQIDSTSQITVTVPDGATTGPIAVTTPAGTVMTASVFTVTGTAIGPPTITGFVPHRGNVGSVLQLIGTNFVDASSVTFNGTPATFRVVSPTLIDTTVPFGATTGPVVVTTPQGTATSSSSFTVEVVVNDLVTLAPLVTSYNPAPAPGAPAGKFTITATFTNTSSTKIRIPYFQVSYISPWCLVLNTDTGKPGGIGARVTPAVGADEILSPNESFTNSFVIGLQHGGRFSFFIDLHGEEIPH